jgi:hypothetical protein
MANQRTDIKTLPSFNLRKEGVKVEVMEWVGELEHLMDQLMMNIISAKL